MDLGTPGQESACSPLLSLPRSPVIPWLPPCRGRAVGTGSSEALWRSSMRGAARREINWVAAFFLLILTVCVSLDCPVPWTVPLAIALHPGRAPEGCPSDASLTNGSLSLEMCDPLHTAPCHRASSLPPNTFFAWVLADTFFLVWLAQALLGHRPFQRKVKRIRLFCHFVCFLPCWV